MLLTDVQETADLKEESKTVYDSNYEMAHLFEEQKTLPMDKQSRKQLFQNVIHDLKSPIGNILGAVYLLEMDLQQDKDREMLQLIKNSCNNALAILSELLIDEKSQEHPEKEETAVNHLIDECLADVTGSLALKNISVVQYKGLAANQSVRIDKQAIKRALLNIITNAVKFSLRGGTINISSEICENKLRISIEDHGIGIPKNLQPYIFKKFTPAQRIGTSGESPSGLGLYFTQQNILKNQGRIWFESIENEGTTFHIEFEIEPDQGC